MHQTASMFENLARLLEYPGEDFLEQAEQCRSSLARACPGVDSTALLNFAPLSRAALDELFTDTLELAPACVPYVGIHLFGEGSYKRGRFMARLRQHFTELSFDPGIELADHLAVLLRLLPRLDITTQKELVGMCLLSPLRKMIGALSPGNPYHGLLQIIQGVLQAEFPDVEPAPLPVDQAKGEMALGCPGWHSEPGCRSAPWTEPAMEVNKAS